MKKAPFVIGFLCSSKTINGRQNNLEVTFKYPCIPLTDFNISKQKETERNCFHLEFLNSSTSITFSYKNGKEPFLL